MFGVALLPQFDVITTSLCLEAACKDLKSYEKALVELANYVKPYGFIVLSGVLNQSYYPVRDQVFFSLKLNEKDIEVALTNAGFESIEWHTHHLDYNYNCASDATGYFTLSARKK